MFHHHEQTVTRVEDTVPTGMDPQTFIVAGLGATPNDSNGFPFTGRSIVSGGNMLAEFRYNVAAESQGGMQACRLYELTNDRGVRDTLRFNIACDTMRQNHRLLAIEPLTDDGLKDTLCPATFLQEIEHRKSAYQFLNHSREGESREGRWANGAPIDGRGKFSFFETVPTEGEAPVLGPTDPRVHGPGPKPRLAMAAE